VLTNRIERLTTKETNIRTKKQYFKVVCLLLKSLSTKYFKYVYFSYLRNVVKFINLVNSKTNIIVTIIEIRLIKIYNERYALNSLKRQNSN